MIYQVASDVLTEVLGRSNAETYHPIGANNTLGEKKTQK